MSPMDRVRSRKPQRRNRPKTRSLRARLQQKRDSFNRRRAERARPQVERMRGRLVPRGWVVRALIALLFPLSLTLGAYFSAPLLESQDLQWKPSPAPVREIDIEGNRRLSLSQVAAATGVAKDGAYREIDEEQVEERLRTHPWILQASVLSLPTGELWVRIEERTPRAVLRWESGDEAPGPWLLVDETGTPFARATRKDFARLPRLSSPIRVSQGKADPHIARAVNLTGRLSRAGLAKRGRRQALRLPDHESSEGWVLRFDEAERLAILGLNDIDQRLDRLALLLDSNLEATRQASVIDLRFADRAVLRSMPGSR